MIFAFHSNNPACHVKIRPYLVLSLSKLNMYNFITLEPFDQHQWWFGKKFYSRLRTSVI